MDISIVVVNYNVKYFLEQALLSLKKASRGLEVEYIVVDNHSTDGSVDYIRANFPEVHLIANDHNFGFGKANNQGLKIAQGEYLLVLNPDTVVGEKTLVTLKSYMDEHPDIGAIGPKIIDREGQFEYGCRRGFPTPLTAFSYITGLSVLFPNSRTLARYRLTYLDPDSESEVDSLAGSFMLVRREAYENIGGFDEDFFMYGEDIDWCYRMKKEGWKVYYYPQTEVIHYKGESALRSTIDTRRAFYDAMWLYVKKHFSKRLPLTLWVIRVGIFIAYLLDWCKRSLPKLKAPLIDLLILNAGLILGRVLHNPQDVLSRRIIIPYLIYNIGWLAIFTWGGIYGRKKDSVISAFIATVSAIAFIFSFTYFFKQFAYSRFVLLFTGILTLYAIPGWRWLIFKMPRISGFREFLKRRTLLVGLDEMTERIALKSQSDRTFPFKVIGFIECGHTHLGQKLSGIEVIGSMEDLNDIVQKLSVEEVVFSGKSLSYGDILKRISLFNGKTAFKVLPESALSNANGELPFLELGYRAKPKFFSRLRKK
jgi:GT2 family glycosyltransferase